MLQRLMEWLFPERVRIKTETVVEKQLFVRMEQTVLNDLRRRVGGTCVVTSATTDHMAGYQLGINHVLNMLQEGYTVQGS